MVTNLFLVVTLATVNMTVNSNPTMMTTVSGVGADAVEYNSVGLKNMGNRPLDKTWTTGVQENEAGSQVLDITALTSPMSFQAKRTGLLEIALIYLSTQPPSKLTLVRK